MNPAYLSPTYMWHGTHPRYVRTIATLGFRREFTTRYVYGFGVYFATESSYSATSSYAKVDDNGVQRMFLCRVVRGVPSVGQQSYIVPMYTTPTNDIKTCDVYVDQYPPQVVSCPLDDQAYPEYLVTFCSVQNYNKSMKSLDIESCLYAGGKTTMK